MPIQRKPAPPSVESFIHGKNSGKLGPLSLRVPPDILAEVDQSVSRRRPQVSRHQWILEAICEKLNREKKG